MKTKEELNAIRNEVETLGRKLAELSEEELAQVSGGNNTAIKVLDRALQKCLDQQGFIG